jgi:hypothetical protein
VIVFLGSLAKHMDKEDPKVLTVVDALVSALSTPSEAVQVRSPAGPAAPGHSSGLRRDGRRTDATAPTDGADVACWVVPGACCMLHLSCFLVHVACCMVHVACCMLRLLSAGSAHPSACSATG